VASGVADSTFISISFEQAAPTKADGPQSRGLSRVGVNVSVGVRLAVPSGADRDQLRSVMAMITAPRPSSGMVIALTTPVHRSRLNHN
jgi:hypothetical protein